MKKEYDFTKAKVHRGSLVSGRGTKVQKTIRLDENVFEWLVKEGKRRGIPYQTLLNSLIKQMMNQESTLLERVEKLEAKVYSKKSG